MPLILKRFSLDSVLVDLLQEHLFEQVDARNRELEMRCRLFACRTGLPTDQITIVHFRSKSYPQWVGAVQCLPVLG